ncbi:HEAT repeat domain-containing protein [Methylocucumis oryzae]|uniref:HEAT repeat domain-containing protein n=1 Tax=Methylocucumis oryzae TaxID=1632867 RepID=A0A0F3IHV7_9GAMM|nr:hypothetical protein [Methylocucumis oryzae]KJV06336.1 hypothetical protein VZ94_11900 [Methylocucumis oryzae]
MCFAQPVLPTHDYQLTAKSQPIAKVLTDAAKIAQVTIHYLGSENNEISVSCHATSVQRFLQCVLKPGANSVFRYGLFEQSLVLSEVWVYSVGSGSFSALDEQVTPHDDNAAQLVDAALSAEHVMLRESAMAELADSDILEQSRKTQVLLVGLSDKSSSVRAQALAGLVKQPGYDTDSELNAALSDKAVDVRLMAVDQASTNRALLQKALQDTDATVRQYAAYKLSELVQSSN